MADRPPVAPVQWPIAGVQMDSRLGDVPGNIAAVRERLRTAADRGARVVIFPECVLTGYSFDSKSEALPFAESVPGRATDLLAGDCRRLGVWAVFGLLERAGDDLFNTCVLIGPAGLIGTYRKTHLPFVGVDRYTTPGDGPLTVYDIGGLRIGLLICYDGSFPEPARVLMLQGADLIALPTNWAAGAEGTVQHLVRCRALENNVYYCAVNRIGEERGYRFLGHSQLVGPDATLLAHQPDDRDAILYAEIDPARARNKRIVRIPGVFELHRTRDRRPELYGPLCVADQSSSTPQRISSDNE